MESTLMFEIRAVTTAAFVLMNAVGISLHVRRQGPGATLVVNRSFTMLRSFLGSEQDRRAAAAPGIPGGAECNERKRP
jgi:hypothetical protein